MDKYRHKDWWIEYWDFSSEKEEIYKKYENYIEYKSTNLFDLLSKKNLIRQVRIKDMEGKILSVQHLEQELRRILWITDI